MIVRAFCIFAGNGYLIMARLTHVALWTNSLERLRDFYVSYFDGKSNDLYVNPKKGFASYFVFFEQGPALEIMRRTDVTSPCPTEHIGIAHLAFHADSPRQVDLLIERFRADGVPIVGEPRVSGDGYYEGVILDPDGNRVEIVAQGEPEIVVAADPPYPLLLEADPDRSKIEAYLPGSACFVARLGGSVVGVIVARKQGDEAEIMNVAVKEIFRRRGIARKLLRHVAGEWAPAEKVKLLRICTGSSSSAPLMLYQQEGFDLKAIDRDYFVRAYPEPIWENGIQCRHRLVLEKRLSD